MSILEILWSVLFIAGITQGLFLAGVALAGPREERRHGRVMASLIVLFALMIGEELVDIAGLYSRWPHTLLTTFPLPLAFGPLLYIYARQIPQPERRLRREWLHFLPLVLVTVYVTPFYLLAGTSKLEVLRYGFGHSIPFFGILVAAKGIQVLAYQVAILRFCTRELDDGNGDRKEQSASVRSHLLWYRRQIAWTLVPVVGVHVLHFLPFLAPPGIESDRLGSLVLTLMIYSVALAAMRGPLGRPAAVLEPSTSQSPLKPQPKYRTSPLAGSDKRERLERLQEHMRLEQPFRDPQLSLDQLASELSMSPHEVSQVINELLDVNFYGFVNDYRIAAVKDLMADADHRHRTLLALALDAGFNSKASFNRVFKERTGLTPSAYRRGLDGTAHGNGSHSSD